MSEPRPDIYPPSPKVDRDERRKLLGQSGLTLWFTGLSGAGKSTLASAVEARLIRAGVHATWLDGDTLRTGLNADLGFSESDRHENIRRVGEVARLFAGSGAITLVSVISPFAADRDKARKAHADEGLGFIEIFVDAPMHVLVDRDPKRIYRRALTGQMSGVPGVNATYQVPESPELTVRTDAEGVDEAVGRVVGFLAQRAPELAPRLFDRAAPPRGVATGGAR